ncbi:Phage-related protein [[Pasteurella] aerogenes]|nr:Phage-related protein [[Pasteurella] aerogenes]
MGKGGGGGRTPYEAPESGRSKQRVKIIEIVSEGEIQGLVDGVKSVYLDNTPIQASDNSYNFNNIEAQGTIGSQDQDVLDGFNTSEKEVAVGVEVKKTQPITRTVTDEKVSRVRVTVGVKALYEQNSQGDTNATSVTLQVFVNDTPYSVTFNGKYSSQYLKHIEITDLPPVPFTLRVERVEADSKSQRLQNGTLWASYTEIIDTQFAYPNTALVGIMFDSEYFNSIPQRNYEIKGIKLRVPSNYDPETRQYDGLWDGTFKIAWSDNPAWVLLDILSNKRYGLGQRLGEINIDKWALYNVAQYCDQLVPDGFGNKEPRFTCNAWLTEQKSAYELINDICSIFRAIPVWTGTELTVIQDRPSDPVWIYTNANVVDGEFTRQYSALKSRHNAIHVEYLDKSDFYQKKIEYVSDDELIRKHGLNVKKVTAFGCTSRGQAYRTGRWILETEKLEKETITFSVGREGLMHIPGDIFEVADNHYAGTDIGGRVLAIKDKTVTLDREIELSDNSYFSYIDGNATQNTLKILGVVNGNQVTLDRAPVGLAEYGVWSLSTQQIRSKRYKAMAIAENDDGTYTITGLQHEPQKEAIVDNGAHFEPIATTLYQAAQITHLDIGVGFDGKVNVVADISTGDGALTYDIKIIKAGKLYRFDKGLTSPNISLDGLPDGEYQLIIYAKNSRGQVVSEKTQTFVIDRPPVPQEVNVSGGLGEITLSWKWVDDITQTEIFVADSDNFSQSQRLAKVNAHMYSHTVGARQVRYYWLRHVRGQNAGPFYQETGLRGESAVDIDEELRLLNEKLSQNIIDEVIDTALPARNLEMIKTVSGLDVNTFLGYRQIHNTADGKLYTWNGTVYVADSGEVFANEIKGIIQPEQLAPIPTANLAGKLTDEQIQSIDATKVIGTLSLTNMPTIPTSKLSGQLTDSQLQGISANKITGTIAVSQLASIPTTKLTGTISANQISANSIGTNAIQAGAIGATHLQSGSVGASQIQANAISSNAIQSGAVVAGKIATNAVVADNIATNAITAVKISAGAITAEKLSANSVGANAIQANAIVAGKIAANAVTTATIAAGAIRANHVAAGELTADKLAIGLGGNLLYNPIFANNGNGWHYYVDTNNIENNGYSFNNATGTYQGGAYLPTENQFRLQRNRKSITGDVRLGGLYQDMKLTPNTYYCFSAYVGGHRSYVDLNIEGGGVQVISRSWSGRGRTGGYPNNTIDTGIENSYRIWILFKTNATNSAETNYRLIINTWGQNGQDNPMFIIRRPMLEECTQYTKEPSAWQNSGVTAIHGGSIVTNTITAQQIAANTITANEIASGAIATRHLSANSINAGHIVSKSLTADKLNISSLSAISANLGTVTAGSISGTTISGGTITGTTIKSARLESVTGKFTGALEVTQLIGGNVFERAVFTSKLTGAEYSKTYGSGIGVNVKYYEHIVKFKIKSAPVDRYVYMTNSIDRSISSREYWATKDIYDSVRYPKATRETTTITPNVSGAFENGGILLKNTEYTVSISIYLTTQNLFSLITELMMVSSRTIVSL